MSLSAVAEVPEDAVHFKLKRISDGDTVVTTEDTRIRLWGIDTPERDQRYGTDATHALTEMLNSQQLYVEIKDVDRYGRTVGIIYTADGNEVNLEMVCGGHAWWYERYAKRATDYEQCQDDAQDKKRGLWSKQNPVNPSDWRSGKRAQKEHDERLLHMTAECGTKKYCREMVSCDEAKAFLSQCGLRRLDGDGDGIPCESICR